MKKIILTAGTACAIAALWALPSFAAGASATDSATTNATNATTAATDNGTASGSSTTNASGSAGANAGANAAGTTVNAGASGSTSASSSMTINDIDVNQPFGATTVDDTQSPEAVSANLTVQQRQDLQSRCSLINQNPSKFAAAVPSFCQNYLDYVKMHPIQ